MIVTNTLPIGEEKQFPQLTVLSIAPLLASTIRAVFEWFGDRTFRRVGVVASIIYHNRCSTSRKTLDLLRDNGIEPKSSVLEDAAVARRARQDDQGRGHRRPHRGAQA